MSGYDVAVWHSTVAMTTVQAKTFYDRLNSDAVLFAHDPQTDSFIADVRHLYPDRLPGDKAPSCSDTPEEYLTSRDDPKQDRQPISPEMLARIEAAGPSVWNGNIDCHGPAATMSIAWDQAQRVFPTIQALAAKHGLTFYETEGGTVVVPPGLLPSQSPPLCRMRVTLRIAGKQPALDTIILFDDNQMAHVTLAGRQQAHDLARQIAAEKGDLGYKVDDPRAMAQAFVWAPAQAPADVNGFQVYRLRPRDEIQQTPAGK